MAELYHIDGVDCFFEADLTVSRGHSIETMV
jgi:hypothetical protein